MESRNPSNISGHHSAEPTQPLHDSQGTASGKDARSLRPENVLPADYAIRPAKDFHELDYGVLCTHPSALAPSPYRVVHWKITVGDDLWKRRQKEAEDANRRARADYNRQLGEVSAENARIDSLNQTNRQRYAAELRAFNSDAEARVAQSRARDEAVAQQKEAARTHLCQELKSQKQKRVVESALGEAIRHARRMTMRSPWLLLWLVLLVIHAAQLLVAPIWAGLSGGPIYLLSCILITRQRQTIIQTAKSLGKFSAVTGSGQNRWRFWSYRPPKTRDEPATSVYSPVHVLPRHIDAQPRERFPLGQLEAVTIPVLNVNAFIACCIPGLSTLGVLSCCMWVVTELWLCSSVRRQAKSIYKYRRKKLTALLKKQLSTNEVKAHFEGRYADPSLSVTAFDRPRKPAYIPREELPKLPELVVPEHPVPPGDCYDTDDKGDYSHTLRGALLYAVDEIRTLARYDLFADGRIRPYFLLGDVPLAILEGESANILVMGATGAGKTTIIRNLMSALIPLTATQVRRILDRSPEATKRLPASLHEWSRSQVYQSVVYNAKQENISFLVALGFDPDVDLFILDPADTRCWCWDVAADINDRDSIAQFAILLTPFQPGSEQKSKDEIWEHQARRTIEAVIVSFRNAAFRKGLQPTWTLRDLREAVATPETLRQVLQFHDTPEAIVAQLIDLSDAQKSSIFMSVTAHISKIGTAAERWEEARRCDRVLSLKRWAKEMSGSVLVLPDTQANEYFNGPINQLLFKALSDLFLTDDYSAYLDAQGLKRYRVRYQFLDEVGEAGRLPDIERTLSQGRSFNLRTIAGVHLISQVQKAYGEKDAASFLGHFPYQALLRTNDPDTAEWMSKRIGDRLRSYDKEQFQYGVSDGQTFTQSSSKTDGQSFGSNHSTANGTTIGTSLTHGTSDTMSTSHSVSRSTATGKPTTSTTTSGTSASHTTSESSTEQTSRSATETVGSSSQHNQSSTAGTSQSQSKTSSEGTTKSKELRGERTVLPSEFLMMRSPRKTKCVEGYYVTPDYPTWKAAIPFDALRPVLENPSALNTTPECIKRDAREDERVSSHKPWTVDDHRRLCVGELTLVDRKPHQMSPIAAPQVVPEPPRRALQHDFDFA